jgi:hypothetical protein
MKKLLCMLCMIGLFTVACNREERNTDRATGMQEEQFEGTRSDDLEYNTTPESVEEVDLQEEQDRSDVLNDFGSDSVDGAIETVPAEDTDIQR